jgi:acyl-coenzyme A thioesterase PaaI-like protein
VTDVRATPTTVEAARFELLSPLTLPDDLRPAVLAPDAPPAGATLGRHFARCFGCGDLAPDGLHLEFRAGEGVSVTASFVVTSGHQGGVGLAHGGVLTAALDETQAALMWLLRLPGVTARLETDFLTPVPVGSAVHLKAVCLGVSGRKIYTAAQGWLTNDQDSSSRGADAPVALRSSALFIAVPDAHFAKYVDGNAVDGNAVVNP